MLSSADSTDFAQENICKCLKYRSRAFAPTLKLSATLCNTAMCPFGRLFATSGVEKEWFCILR